MKINVRAITSNEEVVDACRTTVWKDSLGKEPSEKFMNNIYKSEHSPIRDKMFVINIYGVESWLATHFVRHHEGYTPYVSTQREDRIEYEGSRDDRKQGELVNMRITLNAQAVINVSRKRLCGQAHIKAQQLWNKVLEEIKKIDEPLYNNCVPECIYRGFCPELECCGRTKTSSYKQWRQNYTNDKDVIHIVY